MVRVIINLTKKGKSIKIQTIHNDYFYVAYERTPQIAILNSIKDKFEF